MPPVIIAAAAVSAATVGAAAISASSAKHAAQAQIAEQEQATQDAEAQAVKDRQTAQDANDALLKQMQTDNQRQLDAASAQNTLLVDQINKQAADFSTAQQGLVDAQTAAAASAAAEAQKVETARKQTAQSPRAPNYSASLAANKRLNSGGVSSTMLTGPQGVPTASLNLGKTSLLGAA